MQRRWILYATQPVGNEVATIDEQELQKVASSLGVGYRTVGDLAYSTLHGAIVTGVLAPGERLHQEDLARSLGMSREPIRSAVLQLASDGLVVVHPHRGATVSALSIQEIQEIYELRTLLESHAIRNGVGAMTTERLARLERLATKLDRAKRSPSSVRLRTEFYDVLYDRERHPVVVGLIDRLRTDVGRYWMRRRLISEQEHGHRPLLEFARSNDVTGAVAWLRKHFTQVADELVAVIAAEEAHGGPLGTIQPVPSGARSQ